MAERTGMSLAAARTLWRSLGFAAVDDHERIFTDADVVALHRVQQLAELAALSDETLPAMTRVIGQSFARLAAWQGQMVLDVVAASPELQHDQDKILQLVEQITPLTTHLHDYVWRRQLAAYFARVGSESAGGAAPDWVAADRVGGVGFVDMAGFTTLTRRSDKAHLQSVIERFESLANDAAGDHGGQVVKTIGDEVLFFAEQPADAARIALDLLDQADDDELLPALRAGVAAGPIVRRLGDVFGATVNIASRLTSLARPGTVLADRTMAELLADDDRYSLKPIRAESVRGYHRLHPWRLRSAER